MKSDQKQKTTARVSFLQLFRLTFVLFLLYLLRIVFYRWDGFKFYASFYEFIPAVGLVSILWTIVAFLSTIAVWALFRSFEKLTERLGSEIRTEHLLLYGVTTILIGVLVWKGKMLFWTDIQTSNQLKILVFLCVVLVSAYIAWVLRNRAWHWFRIVQERITPLVWLFGFIVMLSVPTVGFYTWGKKVDKPIPDKFIKSTSDYKHPNILLITFDALTANDISLYGYDRETTPFISKWAGEATVLSRVEAANNHTTPTTASLMTGKRVWTHQVYQQSGSTPLRSEVESLPKVLKDNGYFNLAFIVNPSASTKTLGVFDSFDISPLMTEFYSSDRVFFDIYHGDILVFLYKAFGDKIRLYDWILDKSFLGMLEPLIMPKYKLMNPEKSKTVVPPEIAFNKFLDIYDDLPDPFFAWIHLMPPHTPYLPPAPYRGMFGPYLPSERYRELASGNDSLIMHDTRILYDEFIRYCDKQYEEFIKEIGKRNRSKNTVIILTSDHGESFQHDVFQHAVPALYEHLTHIPLVIKEPGQSDGKVVLDTVEQIDIPATILDMAHIPVPEWMEGRSLVPLMRGEKLLPRPIFSMYFQSNPSRGHQITKGLVAVWEGDYKLIHYLEKGRSLLFNLKNDPEEMDNLFDSEPETGERLLDLIKTNLKKANERIRSNNPAG